MRIMMRKLFFLRLDKHVWKGRRQALGTKFRATARWNVKMIDYGV